MAGSDRIGSAGLGWWDPNYMIRKDGPGGRRDRQKNKLKLSTIMKSTSLDEDEDENDEEGREHYPSI
jgi:hypothetical protein